MEERKFRIKILDLYTDEKIAVMNRRDAVNFNLRSYDRIILKNGDKSICLSLYLSNKLTEIGVIGVPRELANKMDWTDGSLVSAELAPQPQSVEYIKRKIRGESLSKDEIYKIIKDMVAGNIGPLEILAFAMAEYYVGLSMDEIEYLTRSLVETGKVLTFNEPAYDKHSIGGVPGNKVSLLIVPIVAASGLLIPKTSSRAITSPSGTADTMEVLANVELTDVEIKEIVKRTRGCLVWGGMLDLAPGDDLIIKVEYPIGLDPKPQMMASIMAKKMAAGVTNLVLDIPVGKGTKVERMNEAEDLARMFIEMGERLGIHVRCGITYGEQPVGHAVGPALEAKEALKALMGNGPVSLIEKSLSLAGLLIEMGGIVPIGEGYSIAKDIWRKGKAYEKMREIIEAQGGNPNIKPDEIQLGEYVHSVYSAVDGYVTQVDNKSITEIARAAGAPRDKGAGVLLYSKRGYKVKKSDKLMDIFAERSTKLQDAIRVLNRKIPVVVEGMLLKIVSKESMYLA
ncbi:AMP phosphorylase [Candidatus Geothermarchaeota archaeon]|nr:MAG: AMP phosphorylase [Candidatus Geothermarchaeota archaeon]